jgi:hypothetical protein
VEVAEKKFAEDKDSSLFNATVRDGEKGFVRLLSQRNKMYLTKMTQKVG